MRRSDLEQELIKLGWTATTQVSGRNHLIWTRKGRQVVVPQYDLVYDSTAERLLEQAGR